MHVGRGPARTSPSVAQTLLALGALVLATILALTTFQSRNDSQTRRLESLVEVEAVGVLTEVIETLGGYPFDGEPTSPPDPAPLTPAANFGSAGVAAGDTLLAEIQKGTFSDLDDFHGIDGVLAFRDVSDPATGGTESLSFSLGVTVAYVEEVGAGWVPSAAPTRFKRVQAYVTSPDMLASADTAWVERIYTDYRY